MYHLFETNILGLELEKRMFWYYVVSYIVILPLLLQDDFRPVLDELLSTHPGLVFLQGTPEFQERYGTSMNPCTLMLSSFIVVLYKI